MSKEAMKLALEALETLVDRFDYEQFTSVCELDDAKDAIKALEEALKQEQCDCKDPSQCWEPCGELGNSEKHAKVYQQEQSTECVGEPVAQLEKVLRYEPEIFREDRIRMELDSLGEWVKYADVATLISIPPSQQEQGEPVAIYQYRIYDGSWIDQEKHSYDYNKLHAPNATVRVVYTTPQQRKPLTDEERSEIAFRWRDGNGTASEIIDMVEAAHGIKE